MQTYPWPRTRSLDFVKALYIYANFMGIDELDAAQKITKDSDQHAINDIGMYGLPYDHNVAYKLILGDYTNPMYRMFGVILGSREICLEMISFEIPDQSIGGDLLRISIGDRYAERFHYGKCRLKKIGNDYVKDGGMLLAYGSQIEPMNLLGERNWRFYQPNQFAIPWKLEERKEALSVLNI